MTRKWKMHHYSEAKFWQKVKFCATAGVKVIWLYCSFILYRNLLFEKVSYHYWCFRYFISPWCAYRSTPIVAIPMIWVLFPALAWQLIHQWSCESKAAKTVWALGEDAYTNGGNRKGTKKNGAWLVVFLKGSFLKQFIFPGNRFFFFVISINQTISL